MRLTAIVVIILTALAAPFWAQSPAPVASPNTASLPAGSMQAKATTACTECHEARIILQQRLSKEAWAAEVNKMRKWGALVPSEDREALIDYLSTNFGPDRPPFQPPRTAVLTRPSREKAK
jgi:hypothetical protein